MSTPPNTSSQKIVNPALLKLINPGQVMPVYANNAVIFNGPHDMRVVFTEMVMEDQTQEPTQQLRASVSIGYTQAEMLLQALGRALQMHKTMQKTGQNA